MANRSWDLNFAEITHKLKDIAVDLNSKAAKEALRAGAQVYVDAIRAATPVKTGKAKRHVIIYEAWAKKYGDVRFLAGFDKDAFYMFFYEWGWYAMGRAGKRERKGTEGGYYSKSTSSQRGVKGGKFIEGRKRFQAVFEATRQKAEEAIIASLRKALGA